MTYARIVRILIYPISEVQRDMFILRRARRWPKAQNGATYARSSGGVFGAQHPSLP
jgi:hypothetical protein